MAHLAQPQPNRVFASKIRTGANLFFVCQKIALAMFFVANLLGYTVLAANISFTADSALQFSPDVTPQLMIKNGSEADSVVVNVTDLEVRIPSGGTFTLKNTAGDLLSLSASGGSLTLNLSAATSGQEYVSGFIVKWRESSTTATTTVQHTVGVPRAHTLYEVQVDATRFGRFSSDASKTFSFLYDGGFSTKTFTVVEVASGVIVLPPQAPAPQPPAGIPVSGITTSTPPMVPTSTPSVTKPVSTAFVFIKTLRFGSRGPEVKVLQEFLNATGFRIAAKGAGSAGNETEYFGPATLRAVRRFQEYYGIARQRDLGYGHVGPKTRVKLNELSLSIQGPVSQEPSTAVPLSRNLGLGSSGDDVRTLQRLLARDPDSYPEGKITGYFGPLTLAAVKRFQERHGIAHPGDPGYGYVGPKTKAKLNGLYGP